MSNSHTVGWCWHCFWTWNLWWWLFNAFIISVAWFNFHHIGPIIIAIDLVLLFSKLPLNG